ncbi:MAG: FMN-binding negative transcriptional regulator [Jatrophihabitans sp.]
MYVPAHFASTEAEVAELLASTAAVDLITPGPDGLLATLLPMLHDPGAGSLIGHVARNNPHWRAAAGAGDSLAIVRGPDAYVSPSWYPSKAEHGRVVPTWNYLTIHVHGRLVVHDNVEWLRSLVSRLTDRHEAATAGGRPWSVTDAPAAFVEGQLRAIVGVELVIGRIEAKTKLSQNRSAADQAGVTAGLANGAGGARAVAEWMGRRPAT